MFKHSMFELRWRPLKSWAMGHLVFSLKKLKTFALEFIFRVETRCWQYNHHNKLRMAISDVLTVYQSWKHLELFDEVKVQLLNEWLKRGGFLQRGLLNVLRVALNSTRAGNQWAVFVGIKQLYLSQNLLVCWAVTSQLKQIPLLQHHSLLCLDLHIVEPRSVSWICIFEPEPLVVIKEQAMLCRQNTWNVLIIFFITSNINAYHSQKRHCPPPWSVRMSACQRRQGCSTSPFGRRTFATRPPSKAEDMGLSQGSFVSFLKERVKEVFTSIHVSVESTKPAEVYTTRPWHSWELRRELAMSFETDMKYM